MSPSELASPFTALSLSLRIGSIGIAVTSLEVLRRPAVIGPGGLLDSEVQLTRTGALVALRHRAPALTSEPTLNVVRLASACVLIAGAGVVEVARLDVLVLAVATLLLRFCSPLGTHASGVMASITVTAGAIGLAVGTTRTVGFALGFIAAEAALAYFLTGARKARHRVWRSGTALGINATTLMWGRRRSALLLRSHTRIDFLLCWATIVGECCVPLAFVTPLPVSLGILACAGIFHLAVAVEMGLNCFVWSFVATYPAIIYSWYFIHGMAR